VHTSPALVVAVSEAVALGSLGAWGRPVEALRDGIRQIRERTDRPFAVNFLPPDLDEESFTSTLAGLTRT
jgi:nitronate monooxygenase